MRNLETELALLLIVLVCSFFAFRFKLRQIQNVFKERAQSNEDEQMRSIELIKSELRKKAQSGSPTSLTFVRKDKDGETSKNVFTNLEEEICQLDAIEKQIKHTHKSDGNVRVIVRKLGNGKLLDKNPENK